jgi:hypothetical protein
LNPPGKTTLNRMLLAADAELRRREAVIQSRLAAGATDDGWLALDLERRDDFAGMVRLIEKISSDAVLYERLTS